MTTKHGTIMHRADMNPVGSFSGTLKPGQSTRKEDPSSGSQGVTSAVTG